METNKIESFNNRHISRARQKNSRMNASGKETLKKQVKNPTKKTL
jgi:hypothetical protein